MSKFVTVTLTVEQASRLIQVVDSEILTTKNHVCIAVENGGSLREDSIYTAEYLVRQVRFDTSLRADIVRARHAVTGTY